MASYFTRLFLILCVLCHNNQVTCSELNFDITNATDKNCTDTSGKECRFPFTYKGVIYHSCILEINSSDSGWCPTNVDKDGNFLPGRTGMCSKSCSFESEKPENPLKWNTFLVGFLSGFVAFVLILIAGFCIKRCNRHKKNRRSERRKGNKAGQFPRRSSLKNGVNGNQQGRSISRQGSQVGFDRRVSISLIPIREDIGEEETVSNSTVDEETASRMSIQSFASNDSFIENVVRDISTSETEEAVILRKNIFKRQMSGNSNLINYTKSLNEQVNLLPYKPKYEIKREFFSTKEMLGSGNFGYVFLGEAQSLFYPNSKTTVAIKTVNDVADLESVRSLLAEIKILSQLELDLNIVNMVACCTSEFVKTGEIWLLMEYCQLGDMKSFLIDRRSELLNSIIGENSRGSWTAAEEFVQPVDSRILVQWAYDIAKGMKYLARRQIMHGDLAARNILISAGEDGLVAKVADFGLSKSFYDDIAYKKAKRKYVPWKWMAMEYLDNACFNIKSDVWSYGVVMWELFSLGKEPYPRKTYEELVKELKAGYRLPCPEEVQKINSWSPLKVYNKITKKCFVIDPKKRSTFTKVVDIIEQQLTEDEKSRYEDLKGRYHALGKMRKGSIAAVKQEIMTQTSRDENKALLQQFLENRGRGNTLLNFENNAENNKRVVFRRLTSVF